jgi:hypothetical protein
MWHRYPACVASGATYSFSIRLPTTCTNNLAEYEAVRKGMELLLEAGAEAVEIFRDSKLVISQLTEEYRCESELLFPLWVLSEEFSSRVAESTRLTLVKDGFGGDLGALDRCADEHRKDTRILEWFEPPERNTLHPLWYCIDCESLG